MNVKDVATTIHRLLKPKLPVVMCQQLLREYLFFVFQNNATQSMPGAIECVKTLSKIRPLVVASGSPLPLVELSLDRLFIREYFRLVISSESVQRGKPYPDVFLRASDLINISPSQCLVIEDSLIGVKAALSARMQCMVVPSMPSSEMNNITTRVFSSLMEIASLLGRES